ncbi:toxin glutamine deamidase domain-containing protein [Kitasatospora griseola]|uniref:toxin glutamine deamidase domain-containing protein n=1 Tax=Kitasatospora griseola TaxID=2064 RepID=UPI0016712812|nr:toxin glutamine deamidase domain-containing protein [Kitasatospora griseola]GGQ86513.1 hypothetical protein GCM10010195_47650 [Kitasatospora griseola]
MRPDPEPAGLSGPKKSLLSDQGLTPEGKKLLHQNPEGPSLVYPPSNNKAAHAGKALANKFKSDLPPELKNVSNHLPVKDGKTHQTAGSTASGKPNARIKDQTFKAYVDPATMTLVEPEVGKNIREPLRNAIGPDAIAYTGNKVLEEAAKLDYRSRETLARQEERRQLLKDLADQNQEQGTWIDGERVQRQVHGQGSAMDGVDRLLNGHGDDAGFPGMVIGEGHTNAATWPFLRDNMKQLKASGVDTVYLEALRDDAVQHDLDTYFDPRHDGPMPPTLKAAAAKYDQQYTAKLTEMLEAAKANNVKVRAVDGYPARTINEDGGTHERARLMNSYAHDAITSDTARNGKYLVVVGASHAHSTTGPDGTGRIPGTADLLGIPAVHLTDGSGTAEAAPNRASGSTDSNNVRVGYLPTPDNHSPAGAPPQHTDATHQSAPANPGGLGPVHPDAQTPHGSSDHLAGQGPQHDQHEGGTTDHRSGNEHDSTGKPQHEGGPRHPASDGRPFEVEGGLKRPSAHEQQELHDAVPKNTDGTPQRHPDPRVGDWLKKLNGGEPHTANQKNNCLDAALAMVDTVNGHPTVAAPRLEGNGLGEKGGRDRAEQSLGAKFEHLGAGPDGHAKLAEMLHESGHGSQAVITSRDSDGRTHAWHAMNHEGQIVYSDPQLGRVSDKPLYAGEGGLFAIPLTPDRAPLHPASQSPGDHSAPAQPAGVGGNSRQGNSVSDAVAMAKKAEADRTAVAQRKREQMAREKQHTSEEGLANLPDRTKQRLAEQQKVTAQQDDLAGRQSELRKQQQGLADEQWVLAEKRFTSNNRQLEAEQRRVEEHQERLEQQQERLAGQQERLTQQHDRMARHEALDGQAERAAEKQKQDHAPGEGDKPPVKGELDVRRETLIKDQKLLDQEHGALDAKQAELDARRDKLVADGDKLAEDRAALAKRRREGGADSRKAVADDQKKLDGRQSRLDTERKKVDADQHALGETRESLNQRQKWLDKSEWLVDQHGRLTEQELQAKRDNWPEDRLKALADCRERLDKWSAEQAKSELKAKTGAPDEGKWLADKQKWLEGQRDGEGKWHSADQKARLKEQLDVLEELKDSASKPEKQQEQLRQQERLLDERNRLSENRELLEDRQKHKDGDPEQLKWEGERLAHEQGLNDAARQALASGYAGETDPAPFEAPQRYTRVKSGEKGYYYKDTPKKLMNVSIEGAFDVMNDSGSAMANGIAGDKFRPGCVASGLYIDGQSGARRLLVVTASSTKGLAGETAPQHVHPLVKFAYGKEGDPAYDRVKRELGWDSYPAGNPNTRCKCAEPSVMTDILEQVGGRFPGINMNDPVAVGRAMEYARGILGKAFVRPLETGALKDSTGGRVPGYGEYKAPCDNCAPVVGYFGMKSVQLLD